MAKKTIYLSESQYNTIVGLDNSENSTLPPYTATETTTGEGTGDDEPIVADKIAYSMATTGLGNRRSGLYCSRNSKKKIFEGGNSDINSKNYTVPDNLISHYQNIKRQYGDKREAGKDTIDFIINNGSITGEHAYELQSRLSNMDSKSREFQILGGNETLNWLNNVLGRDASLSKKSKQIKSDMGFDNAFIKKHNKNNGGKAHSQKNNNSNVININYENNN
jgi:hypothetical protein